ncbi:MAG: restriction endonuclease subunit S [Planctomycetaceae bacterium]|jgi:type I restriction enzyme S subunit|nr:restriction endonuclease subunit S [Planctomycetaceae bacterium]
MTTNKNANRSGYKLTNVGNLPDGWKAVRFADFAVLRSEHFDPQANKETFLCVELEHIESEFGRLMGTVNSNKQRSVKRRFYKNDVLFGKLRPYLKKYLFPNFDGLCSSEIWVFYANENMCRSDFLFQLVQTKDFIDTVNISTGTKMPRADWQIVQNSFFNLPPLLEQRKIASILSTWDTAIEQTRKLLEANRKLKTGLMQKLLTGKWRFPKFGKPAKNGDMPEEWLYAKLGEVAIKFLNGGTPSRTVDEYWDGDIPWVTGADIIDHRVDNIRRYITPLGVQNSATNVIDKGELLIVTRTGVGKIAIAPCNIAVSQDITGVYLDKIKVDVLFFLYLICQNFSYFKNCNQGTSINGITRDDLTAFSFYLPPLSEQRKIASTLSAVDGQIAALQKSLEKLQLQKKGLMQKLLTGEIRV